MINENKFWQTEYTGQTFYNAAHYNTHYDITCL